MTPAERRAALLEWFYADEERSGMGTADIGFAATRWPEPGLTFDQAELYPTNEAGWFDRCARDLRALARDGQITRGQTGGKATWWYA
jgi:hypothetical protein